MKKIGNKGFTLVELIATVVLLALVMGIGAYSITNVINNSREKDYQLLIKNIKDSVELYYQECKFVDNNCDSEITLGYLVTNGYLKGNALGKDNDGKDNNLGLVNPKDEKDILSCMIRYTYSSGKIVIEYASQNSTNSCPTKNDYASN